MNNHKEIKQHVLGDARRTKNLILKAVSQEAPIDRLTLQNLSYFAYKQALLMKLVLNILTMSHLGTSLHQILEAAYNLQNHL